VITYDRRLKLKLLLFGPLSSENYCLIGAFWGPSEKGTGTIWWIVNNSPKRCPISQKFGMLVDYGSEIKTGLLALHGIYLRPSDISCQYSRSIYTACFIVWQPRCAADTSTNWRQSLFCCCTASLEQGIDGAEIAAIDGLVSSWSENIFVSFCLRAPGYGLTVMRPRSSSSGRNTSASVTVTVTSRACFGDIKASTLE